MNSLHSGIKMKQETNATYVGIFGKNYVDPASTEYVDLQEFTKTIVARGHGIVHGGYMGLMKAAADGANTSIEAHSLSPRLNIGVLEELLELHNIEKANCSYTIPAKGILERVDTLLKLSDCIVVAERGGFGTLLEIVATFHTNQLHKKFGGEVKPIIFVGATWKKLYNDIISSLDMYKQDDGSSFIHFVETYNEALEIIDTKI